VSIVARQLLPTNIVIDEWSYYKYASHNKNKRIYTNFFHCQDAFGFNKKQSGSKERSFVW
jgi:hypothetical protein